MKNRFHNLLKKNRKKHHNSSPLDLNSALNAACDEQTIDKNLIKMIIAEKTEALNKKSRTINLKPQEDEKKEFEEVDKITSKASKISLEDISEKKGDEKNLTDKTMQISQDTQPDKDEINFNGPCTRFVNPETFQELIITPQGIYIYIYPKGFTLYKEYSQVIQPFSIPDSNNDSGSLPPKNLTLAIHEENESPLGNFKPRGLYQASFSSSEKLNLNIISNQKYDFKKTPTGESPGNLRSYSKMISL